MEAIAFLAKFTFYTVYIKQSAFANDAAKTWNNAPNAIKLNKTMSGAKREIKKFVLTLPI